LYVKPNGRTWGGIGVLVGCTLGNMVSVTPIISGTFGIFLVPVTQALGWSRSEFSGVLLIMAIVGVVGYPGAGYLADRYGVRSVALIGARWSMRSTPLPAWPARCRAASC
jgi:MFS family permease